MLRLNRETKAFAQLPQRKLSEAGILERHDLQAMIAASPEAFFAELGEENIRFLAQEIRPDDLVDDRIDLLGADENGAAVIIELKRGHHRMHLLQALSYAGMLSKLDSARFIERVAQFADKSASEIEETLDEFVEGLSAAINKSQRIVLIAEDFDYSVLITAEWLYEKYNVDVRCYRLRLSGDQAAEFLTCERVYPPAELTKQATRVRELPTGVRYVTRIGMKHWQV
jgi:Rad3-related DNA helicase